MKKQALGIADVPLMSQRFVSLICGHDTTFPVFLRELRDPLPEGTFLDIVLLTCAHLKSRHTHIKMQERIARKCMKEGKPPGHFCPSSPSSDPQQLHKISRT